MHLRSAAKGLKVQDVCYVNISLLMTMSWISAGLVLLLSKTGNRQLYMVCCFSSLWSVHIIHIFENIMHLGNRSQI